MSKVINTSTNENWNYTYDKNANVMENSHRDVDFAVYGRASYPFAVGKTEDWELTYLYDAKDMRIFKQKGEENSYYLYDASGRQVAVREVKSGTNGLETQWQFFIFGTEREAMLQKKPGNPSKKFVADEVTLYPK